VPIPNGLGLCGTGKDWKPLTVALRWFLDAESLCENTVKFSYCLHDKYDAFMIVA